MEASAYLHDVRVYDVKGVHVIGHLLSIHEKGMIIASDLPLQPGLEMSLMLEDITSLQPGKKVDFSVCCDGCAVEDGTLDVYCVELSFTKLTSKARELAQVLDSTVPV